MINRRSALKQNITDSTYSNRVFPFFSASRSLEIMSHNPMQFKEFRGIIIFISYRVFIEKYIAVPLPFYYPFYSPYFKRSNSSPALSIKSHFLYIFNVRFDGMSNGGRDTYCQHLIPSVGNILAPASVPNQEFFRNSHREGETPVVLFYDIEPAAFLRFIPFFQARELFLKFICADCIWNLGTFRFLL